LVHVQGKFNSNQADIKSTRKAVHAATIGALIQQGKITSLDQPLTDWNAGLTSGPAGCHANATLRHLLTQTTAFNEPTLCPGSIWAYSDTNPPILNNVAARAWRGTNATSYTVNYSEVIGNTILNPIGAQGWTVTARSDGIRLGMDLEDLGRIGLLLMNRGAWQSQQVIPSWFVDALGSKQTQGITPRFDNANDGHTKFCSSAPLEAAFPAYDAYDASDSCHAQGFSESPYGFDAWSNSDQTLYPGVSPNWAVSFGGGDHYLAWNPGSGMVIALLDTTSSLGSTDLRPGWPIKFGSILQTLDANIVGPNPLVP
jgi:CubicO group peptidase (beta-lactamase class C family)